MKSVLISIRPNWCEKIANGKKTIEVRKTKPRCEKPFKCFLYCTQGKDIKFWIGRKYSYADDRSHNAFDVCGNGNVIGEFVCEYIEKLDEEDLFIGLDEISSSRIEELSCVDIDSLLKYKGNNEFIYGWHISDLKIYDKPKKLSEFIKPCPTPFQCDKCNDLVEHFGCGLTITRPPQSWCYVEEMEE